MQITCTMMHTTCINAYMITDDHFRPFLSSSLAYKTTSVNPGRLEGLSYAFNQTQEGKSLKRTS